MGVLDKFLDVMKLNDDEYDDDYYEDEEEFEDEEPQRKSLINRDRRNNRKDDFEEDFEEEPAKPARKLFERPEPRTSKVTPIREPERPAAKKSIGMEVCLMRPTSVEDSRTIAETILSNRTVVLNLEGLDIEVAQRIIDFASGACFALGGNLQKVSQYIFLLTPASVDISGDLNDLIGDGFGASIGKSY